MTVMFAVIFAIAVTASQATRTVPSKAEDPSLWKPVRSLITMSVLTPDEQQPALQPLLPTSQPADTVCQLETDAFDFGISDKGRIQRIPDAKEGALSKLIINGDEVPIDAFSHLVVTLGEKAEEFAIEYTAAGETSDAETFFIHSPTLRVQVSVRPGQEKLCLNLLQEQAAPALLPPQDDTPSIARAALVSELAGANTSQLEAQVEAVFSAVQPEAQQEVAQQLPAQSVEGLQQAVTIAASA